MTSSNRFLSKPILNQHILSLLEKCTHLSHLKQLQSYLVTLGHGQTQFFAFKLVRFSILSLTDLSYARLIFDHLDSPNIYLYTAMITAYASHSDSRSALLLYSRMLRLNRPRPNHFIFPHVLKSCSDGSSINDIRTVHTQILKSGFDEYAVVQTALVDSYSKYSDLETARRVFDGMSERNVVSWTAMVSGYARVGMVGDAVLLFEEMPERDVPSWNAVIAGCAQNGLFSEAISLFRRMLHVGAHEERPNQITVVCALSACAHLGMLRLGKWIHGYVRKNNIGPSSFIANALLDMYGKCGSLNEARRVFNEMPERSLTLWNSMINCLALHGQSETAITIFKAMEHVGVKPDEVTFVGLLNACTHGGLVDEGCSYFKSMSHDYRIEPQIEHYGCVIDLLGRVGRFEEAMEVIRGMKIETDEVVWGSLLNGSKIHGNMELAELSVRKLLEIDPNNAGSAVMLANIYSECGRWDDVGMVRKMLKERGVQKTPGCSWIEVDNKVHQFYSADKTHPRAEEIHKILEGLAGLSKHDLFRNCMPVLFD
ncbi:pentatricopeptide repeat-containing protein At1g33350-like [Magnolia sinica]|uniref:pentatricopeptide repeat-containing protein At1g33350-like n=1 Tax=Magnolia sinica TaxID=86752 RepID=UPI00265B20A4|nr:pentatricopeptide repeat-containing protein At1g33350-like [Magnolia sinica]XP_058101424.1 pentatricopeptide repeat-containing protein At1g33350-like [Magnolia sinica]